MTLIELMVAMTISMMLIGGLLTVMLSVRQAFSDVEQLSRLQENVRFASDYMVRDIRSAGFRDEVFLRAGHEAQIRERYVQLFDDGGNAVSSGIGTVLRIRYAGRGHCTQPYDEFRIVENEYSVSDNQLVCRGRTVPRDDPGSSLIEDQAWGPSIGLVKGLSGIAFQRICPDGGHACACDLISDFDNSCIGVRIALQFEGLRQFNSGNMEDAAIELTAALRNVILERVNAARVE